MQNLALIRVFETPAPGSLPESTREPPPMSTLVPVHYPSNKAAILAWGRIRSSLAELYVDFPARGSRTLLLPTHNPEVYLALRQMLELPSESAP